MASTKINELELPILTSGENAMNSSLNVLHVNLMADQFVSEEVARE